MKAVLTDGRTIDIGGYKAIDTGIVLTEDDDRDHVIGFLPNHHVEYILPDEVAEEWDVEGRDRANAPTETHGRQGRVQPRQPSQQFDTGRQQVVPSQSGPTHQSNRARQQYSPQQPNVEQQYPPQ